MFQNGNFFFVLFVFLRAKESEAQCFSHVNRATPLARCKIKAHLCDYFLG